MKRALVLCGGGSLGSYEIGVWRFLREKNQQFDIVTGTSIGAINGAIVATGEFEKAETLWKSVAADKVFHNGMNFYDGMWNDLSKEKVGQFLKIARDYVKHGGVDISPLISLMTTAIDPKKVLASPMSFGVVASTFPGFKQVDVDIKKLKEDEVMPWLLASSACYPIFPVRTIKGKKYVDGGYNDNLPIDLALKMGAEEIVAVLLHAIPKMPQHPELMDLPFVTTVRPSRDTGSIMNFDAGIEEKNMTLGYLDAKKTFGEAWGRAFTFQIDNTLEDRFHDFVIRMAHINLLSFPKAQKALTYELIMPKTNRQIYIRTIETVGDWLNMDYLKEYTVDDFLKEIIANVRDLSKKPNIQKFVTKHKFGLHIGKDERRGFLAYLDSVYVNNLKKNKLQKLAQTDPEIGAIMALWDQLKDQGRL
jgi:predicted acylesterase/phospholipase RssA